MEDGEGSGAGLGDPIPQTATFEDFRFHKPALAWPCHLVFQCLVSYQKLDTAASRFDMLEYDWFMDLTDQDYIWERFQLVQNFYEDDDNISE